MNLSESLIGKQGREFLFDPKETKDLQLKFYQREI